MAKCYLCGDIFNDWNQSGWDTKNFRDELDKFHAYDEWKNFFGCFVYGHVPICLECVNKFNILTKANDAINSDDIENAYQYFIGIIKSDTVHKSIDIKRLEKCIESHYAKRKEDMNKLKVIYDTQALISKKKEELELEYGSSWMFPNAQDHNHVCAMKYGDNLVMIENYNPQFSFTEETEKLHQISNNIISSSSNDLFMLSVIPLKNIVSYQLIGNVEHTAITYGGGGGGGVPNLRGAAIGGLLFGGAGAIIGSQTGIFINPISSKILEFDSRRTMLNLKNEEGQVEIRELPFYYSEVFMKVIPEKEFHFLQANTNRSISEQTNASTQSVNIVEEMKQLKELLDMNLITQEEFDSKRQQILKL